MDILNISEFEVLKVESNEFEYLITAESKEQTNTQIKNILQNSYIIMDIQKGMKNNEIRIKKVIDIK